jgi:hypothetical protein
MQNLNLYQVERRRHSGPRRLQMFGGLALIALLCLTHALWQGWRLGQGETRLELALAAAQEQEARLAGAKASFVEPQLDSRLPGELAARELDNQQLQRLVAHLQLLASQRNNGFVAPLQALAQQHPQTGLWLSAISLGDGGRQMRLQGSSQNQELLPRYLEQLGQNPVFQGREFARFDVRRGTDQLLRFDLSSLASDQEQDHE